MASYEPTNEYERYAEGHASTQADILTTHWRYLEGITLQPPERAVELIDSLIASEIAYDDHVGGLAIAALKHELQIVRNAASDLAALGFRFKVASEGWKVNAVTNVYVQHGPNIAPLLEQTYCTYRSIAIATGEMNARRQALSEKLLLIKWFGEVHRQKDSGSEVYGGFEPG